MLYLNCSIHYFSNAQEKGTFFIFFLTKNHQQNEVPPYGRGVHRVPPQQLANLPDQHQERGAVVQPEADQAAQ